MSSNNIDRSSNTLYKEILTEVQKIQMIDTHEHLISEPIRNTQKLDIFSWFSHYSSSDLISSGLSQNELMFIQDTDKALDERWELFSPFWTFTRTTGYGRVLQVAARELHEIEDINDDTYLRLSELISNSNHEGWYEYVLKERGNIDRSLVVPIRSRDPTPLTDFDRTFFLPVFCVDEFVTPLNNAHITALEHQTEVAIHSLQDLLTAFDITLEKASNSKIAAIKIDLAYNRTLQFGKPRLSAAESVFNRLRNYPLSIGGVTDPPPISWQEAKPLQDFLIHHIIRRTIDARLPIQIHTGFQEGNGNLICNANPLHLANLLVEYPEARFDLFHAGYPYHHEFTTLCKNFPNAFANLCWIPAISPFLASEILHTWIETIPANKIFAFGGDYMFVEGAFAHAQIARRIVAQVLTEKIETKYICEEEALSLARLFLRENALSFFRLEN